MTKPKDDYQSLSLELETLLEELQSTDVDIDKAVKQYECGMEIVTQLESHLKTAKNKVKKAQADFRQHS